MRLWIVIPTLALAGATLQAQEPGVGAVPKCGSGSSHMLIRSLVGGTLGGWIGFVGAKIRYSDWNDASHSSSANRARNQATVAGFAIGAVVGSLVHMGTHSCYAPAADKRMGHAMITRDEITHSGQTGTVYDLVYALRRNWLNLRGIDALTEGPETLTFEGQDYVVTGEPRLSVYYDNTKLGSVDELKKISVNDITAVRYFDGAEATYRWGKGNQHGAIELLSGNVTSPK